MPEPLLPATALSDPTGGRVLNPVASFSGASDFESLGLPRGVVIVPVPDDGMGNFVQDGVFYLGAGRVQAITDGQTDAPVGVVTNSGARWSQVETELPRRVKAAAGAVVVEQTIGQRFHLLQRTFRLGWGLHVSQGGIGDCVPPALVDDNFGVPDPQAGYSSGLHRAITPRKSDAAANRKFGPWKLCGDFSAA